MSSDDVGLLAGQMGKLLVGDEESREAAAEKAEESGKDGEITDRLSDKQLLFIQSPAAYTFTSASTPMFTIYLHYHLYLCYFL